MRVGRTALVSGPILTLNETQFRTRRTSVGESGTGCTNGNGRWWETGGEVCGLQTERSPAGKRRRFPRGLSLRLFDTSPNPFPFRSCNYTWST